MAGGRPTKYTEKLATQICNRLANGESLLRICRDETMPSRRSIYTWLLDDRYAEFLHTYNNARELQCDHLADETLAIADDGINDTYLDDDGNPRTDYDVVRRSQLRVSARQWYIGKIGRRTYGDKQSVEMSGVNGDPLQVHVFLPPNGRDE